MKDRSDSSVKLSVIDIEWPGDLVDSAQCLERLGYHRYWTTEHHTRAQSASPTVTASIVACATNTIRVGTAGVLLPFQSPLKVAEDFAVLELFFGPRLDLGVASGVPVDVKELLLDGRPEPDFAAYAEKVESLTSFVRRGISICSGIPLRASQPQLWICGTSLQSAQLAAQLGVSYAFHDFLFAQQPNRGFRGPDIVKAYLDEFQPRGSQAEPCFNVACYGACADTEEEARARWQTMGFREAGGLKLTTSPQPSFLGSPDQCRSQLLEIAARYGASEIVVRSSAVELEARLDSYRGLAEVFGLHATHGSREPRAETAETAPESLNLG